VGVKYFAAWLAQRFVCAPAVQMFRPFVPKGDVIILEVPDDDRVPSVIDDVSLLSQAFLRALALSNVAYGNDRQQRFVAPIVNESTAIIKNTLPTRPN